jgi:hypothetical protein
LSEAIPVAFALRRWTGRRDPRRAAGHRSDQAQPAGDPAFTNFNQRNTPEIGGEVKRIGADLPRDDKYSPGYFVVSIVAPPDELARLGDVRLLSACRRWSCSRPANARCYPI